jgi:hypothetical protein
VEEWFTVSAAASPSFLGVSCPGVHLAVKSLGSLNLLMLLDFRSVNPLFLLVGSEVYVRANGRSLGFSR